MPQPNELVNDAILDFIGDVGVLEQHNFTQDSMLTYKADNGVDLLIIKSNKADNVNLIGKVEDERTETTHYIKEVVCQKNLKL